MKRIIAILCALMALTSCKRIDLESLFERQEQIKVDLTIDKEDTFGGSPETRATFKDAWDDGDVVFVFIRDVPAPKYLEMKYSKGEWTATPKNGLTADDLRNAPSKQMTGVFLPYASDATVMGNNVGYFYFAYITYLGLFYADRWEDYTYDTEMHGRLYLHTNLIPSSQLLVHFDVTGYREGHVYTLYQEHMKPLHFADVTDMANPRFYFEDKGGAINGYIDKARSIVSFSGGLDESVAGKAADYSFLIVDETSGARYTRTVPAKTISENMSIGLGNISDPSVWTAISNPFIDVETTEIEMGGAMDNTPGFISYSVEFPIEGEKVTAKTSDSWIRLGEITDTDISFTADKNSDGVRTGTITLEYKNAEPKVVTIKQYGFYDNYTVVEISEHKRDVSHEGGTYTVDYNITNPYSGCTLEFRYDLWYNTSHPDWIEGKYENGILSYTVKENTGTSSRKCDLLVKYSGTPNVDTLTVTQFGKPAGPPKIITYANPDAPETISAEGDANVLFEVKVENPVGGVELEMTPDVSWITNIRHRDYTMYCFTASRNTTGKERFGHINLSYQDQKATILFKQLADDVVIILNPGDMTFNYQARSVSFNATLPSGYDYNNLQVEFVQDYGFVKNLKRNGNEISFDMTENNTGYERSAGIVVKCGSVQSVFTVTQTYEAPVFTLSQPSLTLNYASQTMMIDVQVENPREGTSLYALEEGDTPWLASSGVNGVPVIRVNENKSGASRNTVVLIGYEGMSEKVRLYVTQNTSSTGITVTPNTIQVPSSGGSQTFTVTVTDPLYSTYVNATEGGDWISLGSVNFDSDVQYTVTAQFGKNLQGSRRNSTVTFTYGSLSVVVPVVQDANTVPEGFVDLGLPSGTLWAKCNLGAATEYNIGNFYAWGETSPKSNYSWNNYAFGIESNLTKYNPSDYLTALQNADNPAYQANSSWSMPTEEQFRELEFYCDREWVMLPVPGLKFKSRSGGTYVFFPATGYREDTVYEEGEGYYWSKSVYTSDHSQAYYFGVNDRGAGTGTQPRSIGMPVRPVRK